MKMIGKLSRLLFISAAALGLLGTSAALGAPSVPTITFPANNSVLTPASFTKVDWTDSTGTGTLTYEYEAFSDPAYTVLVYGSGFSLSASEIPTPSTPLGVYYVRVRAQDSSGTSDWSNGSLDPYKITVAANDGLATPLADFRDVRRPADINLGPDVCGTGNPAINLTGSTGSAGDTWITVYDTTPADDAVQNTFGSVSLSADVIIRPFNNRKGAGLLALFNEGTGKKGLALVIYDAGNTDTLVLGTVSKANGTFTVLTEVALANRIQECAWYRLTMDVAVDGGVTVTGNVFKHVTPTSPNSAVDGLVGTLSFTGPLPTGVDTTGEVGIVGSAFSAVLDSSVTNFTIEP